MRNLILLLALVACPLMMIWCMRSMRGHGSQQTMANPDDADVARLREEVGSLQEELAALRAKRILSNTPDGQG